MTVKSKATIMLIVFVAVGFFFVLTLMKRRPSWSSAPIACSTDPVIFPKTTSPAVLAKRESDQITKLLNSAALFVSHKPDSGDEETQQLLLTLCTALGSNDGARHNLALSEVLPALVKRDAEAASYLAETWPSGLIRADLLRRISQEWSKCDPIAAIAWAANLKDYGERMSAIQDGCVQISQSAPEEAMAIATRFQSDDGTLESIAQLWARKDSPAALAWARHQAQGEQRDRLVARIAFVKAETGPIDAAQLVSTEIAPGEVQNEAFICVLRQWALTDPAAAAAWLANISVQPLRERAINELAGLARN